MAAGCRQQDALKPALLNLSRTLKNAYLPSCARHPCCCATAMTTISTVLALEVEEDLEEAEGCRQDHTSNSGIDECVDRQTGPEISL